MEHCVQTVWNTKHVRSDLSHEYHENLFQTLIDDIYDREATKLLLTVKWISCQQNLRLSVNFQRFIGGKHPRQTFKPWSSYLPSAIIKAHVGPSLLLEEMRLLLLLLVLLWLFSNMSLTKREFLSCDMFMHWSTELILEHEALD